MKRFYLVHDKDMPGLEDTFGHWHAIHLGSHSADARGWNAVVLIDEHIQAPPSWHALPSALNAKKTMKEHTPHHVHLKAVGLTGDETTIEVATRLAEIHPQFWT